MCIRDSRNTLEIVGINVSALERFENGAEVTVELGFGAKVDRPGFQYFEVMSEELMAVVPVSHPLAQKENITLEELCREPLVTYNSRCGTRYDLENFFREYGVRPRQIIEAQNEKMIASMVAAGIGVSIMPWIQEVNVYHVVSVPLEHHRLKRLLYMFWRQAEFRLPAVYKRQPKRSSFW